MSSQHNPAPVAALTANTQKLVNTLTEAILATAEVAAERIELAAAAAQVQQRMASLGDVLEGIATQKQELLSRIDQASGSVRLLLEHQVAVFAGQEQAILARAGVSKAMGQMAVNVEATGSGQANNGQSSKRSALVNGTSGNRSKN